MELSILLLTIIITVGADLYINIKYKQTNKIKNSNMLTGEMVARKILDSNGLKKVKVQMVSGKLTDHYDPTSKTVNLSADVYQKATIAALSVAAHECGHAIQDKEGYIFLRIRSKIVPVVNLASKLGYISILVGALTSLAGLIMFGILAELVILLFQIITLPVEFNASSRALKQIKKLKISTKKDDGKAKGMLFAAALTYVASVASSILQILRLVIMANNND